MSRRSAKHGVACHGLLHRHFFLQHVPVLDDAVILETEDVDGNESLSAAAGITAVDHDKVAFSDDHAVVANSTLRKALNVALQAGSTRGDVGVVLYIVG